MNNQTKVGLFAIITIVIFIFGFYFLKGTNMFSTKNKYYAVFERVDGLYKSNPVVVNGYKIGIVGNMSIDQNGKVLVEMVAEDDFQIPKNSTASIMSTDLVGSKVINIKLIPGNTFFDDGDTIPAIFKKDLTESLGEAINPLMGKLDGSLKELDGVLSGLKFAFDAKNDASTIARLNASLANITSITENLKNSLSGGSLDHSLKNIESFTGNLEKNNQKIDNILTNVNTFTDSLKEIQLAQTVANANKAISELNSILKEVNQGNGTVTKLIKDRKVYDNLEAATANLDKLLVDIKAHPFRYVNISVFGGQKRDEKYLEKKAKEEAKKAATNQ